MSMRPAPASPDHLRLAVAPGRLAGPTLARIIGIGASRAELPVDRLEDAMTVADIVALRAPALLAGGARLELSAQMSPGRLELQLGPLAVGGAEQLLTADGVGSDGATIERLANAAVTIAGSAGECLSIELLGDVSSTAPGGTPAIVQDEVVDFAVTGRSHGSGVHILSVRGEIDISTAPKVKLAAREAVFAGNNRVVLDLSNTTFLDSTGLGVIIALARLLRPDGDIAIVNSDPSIAKTFEITGLAEIFTVCATREEAIAALKGTG
ncbi:MAG TPA: STAS domain-containing protein [Solirubrobacteraceae bacterium]